MNSAHYSIPIICFLLYVNAFDGGFRYDDIHSIVDNQHLRSLNNVLAFFLDPDLFSQDSAKSMYRPVLLVSYAINYYFSGYESWSYHLVNILLHAACALCVFFLGKRIIGGPGAGWIATICFICHPVGTEVVNYISSRSESLAAFFYLLCIVFSTRTSRGKAFGQYASYVVGLLSKSIAITAPITIFLLDYSTKNKRNSRHYLFFGLLAIGYLGLIYGNRFLLDSLADPVRSPIAQFFTQLKAPAYYLYLAFVPVKLSIHHPFIVSHTYMDWTVILSIFFVGSLVFLAWTGRQTIGGWAMAWMGISLMPTFIMPLNMLVNERRLYLPLVAMSLSLSWMISRYKRLRIFGVVTVIIWSGLTMHRTSNWGNEIALWKAAEKLAPNEHNVQNNLGKSLQKHGYLSEAMAAYERAQALDPSKGEAANNIATLHHQAGERMLSSADNDSGRALLIIAKHWYHQARVASPSSTAILANLASAHILLGELDSSYQYFEECLQINAQSAAIWNNYGQALYDGNELFRAQKAFKRAIALDATLVEPINNLANVAQDFGKTTESEKWYKTALIRATGKNRESIVVNLVSLLIKTKRFTESRKIVYDEINSGGSVVKLYSELAKIEIAAGNFRRAELAYDEALLTSPDSFELYIKRAEIRLRLHEPDRAIGDFLFALTLDNTSARAFYGLGDAYRKTGNNVDAAGAFKQFLVLWPPDAQRSIAVRKWLLDIGELN
ncbi:MAG: tetratricopeptide repeat protein [Candidatus Latescibacterota bacterium]|nr:tetratricopeptide repeat protein [Candidatus Latescibacterota bacterium]